jgi:hypothetical protein
MNHSEVDSMELSSPEARRKKARRQSESGQIIIEYVLLLAIAVGIATLITKTMVSRTKGSEGFVIQAWEAVINQIAADHADDIKRDGE